MSRKRVGAGGGTREGRGGTAGGRREEARLYQKGMARAKQSAIAKASCGARWWPSREKLGDPRRSRPGPSRSGRMSAVASGALSSQLPKRAGCPPPVCGLTPPRRAALARSISFECDLALGIALTPPQCLAGVEHLDVLSIHPQLPPAGQEPGRVMGKHGENFLEELLLGSVTKHVLAESQGDVLVSALSWFKLGSVA